MEGLIEIVVLILVQVVSVIFDPITRMIKRIAKMGKGFYDYLNPNNLPEILTFEDLETEDEVV